MGPWQGPSKTQGVSPWVFVCPENYMGTGAPRLEGWSSGVTNASRKQLLPILQ